MELPIASVERSFAGGDHGVRLSSPGTLPELCSVSLTQSPTGRTGGRVLEVRSHLFKAKLA